MRNQRCVRVPRCYKKKTVNTTGSSRSECGADCTISLTISHTLFPLCGIGTRAIYMASLFRPCLLPVLAMSGARRLLDGVLPYRFFPCGDHSALRTLLRGAFLISRMPVFLTRRACEQGIHIVGLQRRSCAATLVGIDAIGDNAGS